MLLKRNTAQKKLTEIFQFLPKKNPLKTAKKAQDNDKIHEEN